MGLNHHMVINVCFVHGLATLKLPRPKGTGYNIYEFLVEGTTPLLLEA
jgi:hypothetical protein